MSAKPPPLKSPPLPWPPPWPPPRYLLWQQRRPRWRRRWPAGRSSWSERGHGRLARARADRRQRRTVAKDAVDDAGPRVFEPNEWVSVLLATVSGLLPRLATGCGKATVVDFDFATRTYSVKSLAMYARGQTMITGSAVVYTCRGGTEEMYSRGSAAARWRGRSTRSRDRTASCSSRSSRGRDGKSSARIRMPRSGTAEDSPLDSCLPPSLCIFYWPTHHRCNPAQR